MCWQYWASQAFWGVYDLFFPPKKQEEPTLSQILDYLVKNPGEFYVTSSNKGAVIYIEDTDELLLVQGDFNGSPEWCRFEIQRRLVEMGVLDISAPN